MALANTGEAIGAMSAVLRDRLDIVADNVIVGRPDDIGTIDTPTLNLFLYEVLFDPGLRDTPLDDGQAPPLWLVLKYLLTAFDGAGNSASIDAHNLLGQGMRALQNQSFLAEISTFPALLDNPETLKLKFDEVSSDLISKVMQGAEDHYRCSAGFEVRPVMIAADEAPSYSLLVGIDYTEDSTIRGEEGIRIPVIPSMGPVLRRIEPETFEPNEIITLWGDNLDLANLSVWLGPVELPVIAQSSEFLRCRVEAAVGRESEISAGNHPLRVEQVLSTGRRRPSNMMIAGLLPVLSNDVVSILPSEPDVIHTLELSGLLLGSDDDDAYIGLYQEGTTIKLLDDFVESESLPEDTIPQSLRRIRIREADNVQEGVYRVIFRVNGLQARYSPEIELRES